MGNAERGAGAKEGGGGGRGAGAGNARYFVGGGGEGGVLAARAGKHDRFARAEDEHRVQGVHEVDADAREGWGRERQRACQHMVVAWAALAGVQ